MNRLVLLLSLSFAICSTTLGAELRDSLKADTLCFEIDEAKNLLQFAEKGYFCDSILYHERKKDSLLRAAILVKDDQLQLSGKVITQQAKQIKRLKWFAGGLGVGLLVALVLGILF